MEHAKDLVRAALFLTIAAAGMPAAQSAPTADGARDGLAVSGLEASASVATAADAFPAPPALSEGIAFWKRVWSEWSLQQVVLHDDVHHQVIYEIVDLPGPIGETYTDEQRDFVKAQREELAARLETLEAKLAVGAELDDDEKALALVVTTAAGADAIEGAHERVRSQRGLRERFLRGVEVSGRYLAEFKAIFRAAGLPEDLAYLPHVESSFQADARSSAGAVGMWQFTRPAAKLFLTMAPGVDERLDPVAAARGAARYMKKAFDELGSWPLAVTSYNHGLVGMRRAKERFGTDFEAIVADFDGQYFGFASRNFYMSFLAARDLARSYEATPPPGLAFDPPLALDRIVLEAPASASALARRFGLRVNVLVSLNRSWTRKAVRDGARIPAGVQVWLPEGTLDRVAARADGRVHTVSRGETLVRIARQYGVRLSDLLDENGLRAESVVRPGQRIQIPTSD